MKRLLLLYALAVGVASAQPRLTLAVHGADYSSAVAPGSLATLFGTGLASSTVSTDSLPYPTTLAGASVTVNGRAAAISYVSPTQIYFQIPIATPAGTAILVVRNGTQSSNELPLTVVPSALGVFTYSASRGLIQNQNSGLNGPSAPAAAGSPITVYLSGIGVTTPAVADGAPSPSSPPAIPQGTGTATIGGLNAPISFLGLSPGGVGMGQANLQVPQLPSGDYPLVLTLNGRSSRPVQIAVSGPLVAPPTGPTTPPDGLTFPDGATCLTGKVDSVVFSLENKLAGLADEIVIGNTRLCPKCEVKPPLAGPFVQLLDEARENGREVDACHFRNGLIEWIRVRR